MLLLIAWYERELGIDNPAALPHISLGQAKKTGSLGFYETLTSVFEKVADNLPRPIKRMCKWIYCSYLLERSLSTPTALFDGLAGSGADIDVVRHAPFHTKIQDTQVLPDF